MKGLLLFSVVFVSTSFGSVIKRAAEEVDCCDEKSVGDISYILKEIMDTSRFGCKDNCVYKAVGKDGGPSICFKVGNLTVECEDQGGPGLAPVAPGKDFHWCYEGECGPDYWYSGNPEGNEACGGSSQSPIDLPDPSTVDKDAELPSLTFTNYDKIRILDAENAPADILGGKDNRLDGMLDNNGHTAVLNVMANEGDGVLSGGPLSEEYQMAQFHFHWGADDSQGSEHTVAGKSFPMELHVVHVKSSAGGIMDALAQSDGLAVTGFMFEISEEDNEAIDPLLEALENIKKYDASFDMSSSPFKVSDIVPVLDNNPYMTYSGSLTTPPCSEAVVWLNFIDTIPISSSQMAKFRELDDSHGDPIVDNFRPPQPLNGRVVKKF